ncbi:hypothetical protein L0F63_003268 [Massospora cicadina]|nr:hypothetical protein L0F63_003268 [Massospora cicadina]
MAPNSAAGTPGVPVPPPNFQFLDMATFHLFHRTSRGSMVIYRLRSFHPHLPSSIPIHALQFALLQASLIPAFFTASATSYPFLPASPGSFRPPASNSEQDFDVLKRRLGLSETKLEHVRSLLNNVLDRCNQADMAHAKQWILEHCQDKRSLGELFQAFRGLKQDKKFETTLRTLYLANDLLFHELKHSSAWIKVELWPHLVPLAREAASLAGPEQREHLTKLVELWSAQKCLSPEQLVQVRAATQALEARSLLPVTRPPFPAAPLLRHPPALVPYHKVPAGVMVELSKDFTTPYTPIPVRKAQFVPMLPPDAAMNLAGAINEFYEGMDKGSIGLLKPEAAPPHDPDPGLVHAVFAPIRLEAAIHQAHSKEP